MKKLTIEARRVIRNRTGLYDYDTKYHAAYSKFWNDYHFLVQLRCQVENGKLGLYESESAVKEIMLSKPQLSLALMDMRYEKRKGVIRNVVWLWEALARCHFGIEGKLIKSDLWRIPECESARILRNSVAGHISPIARMEERHWLAIYGENWKSYITPTLLASEFKTVPNLLLHNEQAYKMLPPLLDAFGRVVSEVQSKMHGWALYHSNPEQRKYYDMQEPEMFSNPEQLL